MYLFITSTHSLHDLQEDVSENRSSFCTFSGLAAAVSIFLSLCFKNAPGTIAEQELGSQSSD